MDEKYLGIVYFKSLLENQILHLHSQYRSFFTVGM